MRVSDSKNGRLEEDIRLNRYLAMCGLGSRREVESLIISGRITIDGDPVIALPTRVKTGSEVMLDGKIIFPESNLYLLMNKPLGVVCAVKDKYYITITGILPEIYQKKHVFPVGRLDRMTSGLIILTNDGDFAQKVIHPRAGIEKMYEVLLSRKLSDEDLSKWRKGVRIDNKHLVPVSVIPISREPYGQWVRVTLSEGVKREIRVMAQVLGYSVNKLSRKRIGKMELTDLPPGSVKALTKEKIWEMITRGGKI